MSTYTAAGHVEKVAESQQLAIRIKPGRSPSRVDGELLIEADGSVALLSPCSVDGKLATETEGWLESAAEERKQTPSELVVDLVEDPSLAEKLSAVEQPTDSPSLDPSPTSSSSLDPPPGARVVRVAVKVPTAWLAGGESGPEYSLCARTASGIGTCAVISGAVGPEPDLFVLAGPDEPIEVIVVKGMDSDVVVGIAGTIAPVEVVGDTVETALQGDPEVPRLRPDA